LQKEPCCADIASCEEFSSDPIYEDEGEVNTATVSRNLLEKRRKTQHPRLELSFCPVLSPVPELALSVRGLNSEAATIEEPEEGFVVKP
jgi:hypothetical protein